MTSYKRGDVILVYFPYNDSDDVKSRPALVIQNEKFDTGFPQTMVICITSNIEQTGTARILVKQGTAQCRGMGLKSASLIAIDKVATIHNSIIKKKIGACPIMKQVDTVLEQVVGL